MSSPIHLTDRERTVLHLTAEGHTIVSIASYLRLSPNTVKRYRYALQQKFGATNSAHLVYLALKQGVMV